jgi:hypothetical protein
MPTDPAVPKDLQQAVHKAQASGKLEDRVAALEQIVRYQEESHFQLTRLVAGMEQRLEAVEAHLKEATASDRSPD